VIESASDQVISLLDQMILHYHRLIIIVAPAGSEKNTSLHEVAALRPDTCCINLNLVLSQQLLPFTAKQRPLYVPRLLDEIVKNAPAPIILFDHIELLFEPTLKQHVLPLLQNISRNRTIVVSWNGTVEQNFLIYAQPDHPEYQHYPKQNLLIVRSGVQV
jgi:hypothetical protein